MVDRKGKRSIPFWRVTFKGQPRFSFKVPLPEPPPAVDGVRGRKERSEMIRMDPNTVLAEFEGDAHACGVPTIPEEAMPSFDDAVDQVVDYLWCDELSSFGCEFDPWDHDYRLDVNYVESTRPIFLAMLALKRYQLEREVTNE